MSSRAAVDELLERLKFLSAHARDIAHAAHVQVDEEATGTGMLERVDLYALISLGVVHELAEGVISEVSRGRASNAVRLARHLMELDLESSWIAEDPGSRLRRRIAEEFRNAIERTEGAADAVPRETYEDMRAYLDNVKIEAGTVEKNGRAARLVPGFRDIARCMHALEDYDRHYTQLSWMSHPGFVLAYRSVRPKRAGDRIVVDYSTDYEDVLLPLRYATHSTGRCAQRCAQLLAVDLPQDFRDLIESVDLQLRTTHLRGAFDDPVMMMAAFERFSRELPVVGPDQALENLSHLTEEQRGHFRRLIDALAPHPGSQS